VFLSLLEPPETSYYDTDSNNMFAVVLTPRQLACQVGGSVKCDFGSTMARATCPVAGASGVAPDGGVCFHGEFSVVVDAFALG
jgi:hypothetical protein